MDGKKGDSVSTTRRHIRIHLSGGRGGETGESDPPSQ